MTGIAGNRSIKSENGAGQILRFFRKLCVIVPTCCGVGWKQKGLGNRRALFAFSVGAISFNSAGPPYRD